MASDPSYYSVYSNKIYYYIVYCAGIICDYNAQCNYKESRLLQNSGALTMIWSKLFLRREEGEFKTGIYYYCYYLFIIICYFTIHLYNTIR